MPNPLRHPRRYRTPARISHHQWRIAPVIPDIYALTHLSRGASPRGGLMRRRSCATAPARSSGSAGGGLIPASGIESENRRAWGGVILCQYAVTPYRPRALLTLLSLYTSVHGKMPTMYQIRTAAGECRYLTRVSRQLSIRGISMIPGLASADARRVVRLKERPHRRVLHHRQRDQAPAQMSKARSEALRTASKPKPHSA